MAGHGKGSALVTDASSGIGGIPALAEMSIADIRLIMAVNVAARTRLAQALNDELGDRGIR